MSWNVLVCLILPSLLCLDLSLGPIIIATSGQGQKTEVKVLERGNDWECPATKEREQARNQINMITSQVIASVCHGTPGWRRVAFVNMTDTSYNCPTGLNLTSYSKRSCGRSHTVSTGGCSTTTFSVGGLPYSSVCGRIRGYQFGSTSAFRHGLSQDIDSYYVDGISLTHRGAGGHHHIWIFAAGLTEVSSSYPNEDCPCDTLRYDHVPTFVGSDYFCESGLHSEWNDGFRLYPDDVLWDGQGCTAHSTCCQLNNPPWFTKYLPNATTNSIELRLCTSSGAATDDIPIELIELYVQ